MLYKISLFQKKIIFLLILVFFLLFSPFLSTKYAYGGTKDSSEQKYISRIIDHSITPKRLRKIENRIYNSKGKDIKAINQLKKFSKKTIFWKGTIKKFNRYKNHIWILILSSNNNQPLWIYAKNNIRNLDIDREGYLIGVKGHLVFERNLLSYIKARSIVLIGPPSKISLYKFIKNYNISNKFEINKNNKNLKFNHIYYPFVLHRIYMHNPHYSWNKIEEISKSIIYFSYKYCVDPLLITALINIESAFDTDAVSSSGALGLGQLMPSTAHGLGVNPKDPFENIGGCVKYLKKNLNRWSRYRDPISMALASYNAGPGAVSRYGGVPPYSETKNYVFFIKFLYKEYKKQFNELL